MSAAHALFRGVIGALVRLYYPSLSCEGGDRLPAGAPLVFLPNHPNALLDPLVLRLAVGRPTRFLAKSTLFGNPLGKFALDAYGALPVFRQRDGGAGDKNEATFAACRSLLTRAEPLALFPEGTSHSDPTLKPLKTGAARISLGAEAEHDFGLGVLMVPASLVYESKSTFRSRALVVLGEPIRVAEFAEAYRADERAAVIALTERVKLAMDEVVAQAETRELLDGVARVAEWTGDPDAGPASRQARTLTLLAAYREWERRDPERTARVVERASAYIRVLRRLGVRDPWAVEVGAISWSGVVRVLVTLLVLAPFALVGAILGWAPYRLAGRVAARVAKEEDVLGTVKLLGGALFLLVAWLLEAAAIGARFGWRWSPLALVAAAACGYTALRWDELATESRDALTALAFRRNANVAASLARRRQELASEVQDALRDR